ncbi:hypothetical protein KP509_06G016900 [Ceratopteris richardii]|uniref:DNA/RNA-binding protein Alba-like domain-containing protein n=1 Tax=Ceratopteris richardii TaxID=49495 RepID=A0A8T2UM33_CERRI|nr:hypothetical protein KP509_06G016900 [Ceratopteris richardii]
MDRYQRVERPRPQSPISENEICITTLGKMRNYITYATFTIAEIIKRRIPGLHQVTSVGSSDITDVWEPLEERVVPLEQTRHVSMITITLSLKELDTSSSGYQPPLPFQDDGEASPKGVRGRGRGRGPGRA